MLITILLGCALGAGAYYMGYYRAAYLGEQLRRKDFELMSGFYRPKAATVGQQVPDDEALAIQRAIEIEEQHRKAEEVDREVAERMTKEFMDMGHTREAAEQEARRLVANAYGSGAVGVT